MMLFYNDDNPVGQIRDEEFVHLGKKHGVPTFNDAAADVPPVDNLWKYTEMGFDLVTFSGGKGIRGPQSSGLLLGRKDLIEAARLNAPPNGNTVGRGMKVNKEEMLGLLVALELFLEKDHARERLEYDQRAEVIRAAAVTVPGVKAEVFVPEIANNVPHIRVSWEGATEAAAGAVVKAMRDGEPSIGIRTEGKDARARRVDDAARRGQGRRPAPAPGAGRSEASRVMRRLALLVPLVGLLLAAGPGSSANDTAARVRFPADVPPRNDIRLENRVPIPHARRRHALRRRLPPGRRGAATP